MATVQRGDMGTGQKHDANIYVHQPYPNDRVVWDDIIVHCSIKENVPASEYLITISMTHDEALNLISQLALRIKSQELRRKKYDD